MARYRGVAPLPQANDSGAPATTPDYYVDVDGKVDRDLARLNAAEKSLEHIVLKSKFMELEEACRHVEVAVLSHLIHVADFALGRVMAVVAGDAPSDNALRNIAEASEIQIKCNPMAVQLSSTSECGTWRMLA